MKCLSGIYDSEPCACIQSPTKLLGVVNSLRNLRKVEIFKVAYLKSSHDMSQLGKH